MVDHGRPRSTKVDQCQHWSTKVDHDRPRSTMVEHGRPRSTKIDHGQPWSTKVDHGRPRSTMVDHGRPTAHPPPRKAHTRSKKQRKQQQMTVRLSAWEHNPTATPPSPRLAPRPPGWQPIPWQGEFYGVPSLVDHDRPWSTLVDHGRP